MERIILPTVRAMARDGRPFKGVLYAGLMLTEAGPKLLEYNVRFGDPECQALMMRLKSDLLPALIAARDGILRQVDLRWHDEAALCVVMAAKGYPDDPERGGEIRGLDRGRPADPDGQDLPRRHQARRRAAVADGGRVLGVTALGRDLAAGARPRLSRASTGSTGRDGFCRRDIGARAGRKIGERLAHAFAAPLIAVDRYSRSDRPRSAGPHPSLPAHVGEGMGGGIPGGELATDRVMAIAG